MTLRIFAVVALALFLVIAACGDDEDQRLQTPAQTTLPAMTETPGDTPTQPTAASTPTPGLGPAAGAAIDALATWLGPAGDPSAVSVESIEAVTWPNGGLGLGEVGQACS